MDLLQLQTKKRAPGWAASEQLYVPCNIVAAIEAALREGGGPSECHRSLKPAAEHTKCLQQSEALCHQELEGNQQSKNETHLRAVCCPDCRRRAA
jgi:hypothetical protein